MVILYIKFQLIRKIINIKLIEEIDWIRKNLMADSEFKKFFFLKIKGRKEKVLISNPIQHPIHELAEIEINKLKIIKIKNINLELLIKKKKINLLWMKYEFISLFSLFFFK